MNIRSRLAPLLLLCLASPSFSEARAQPDVKPLIKKSDAQVPPHEPDSSILREFAVTVDTTLATDPEEKRVMFPIFDGTKSLELRQTKRTKTGKGAVIWSGRVADQPASNVVFVANKKILIANIATQPTKEKASRYYQIRFLGNGLHVFREIDPAALAPEDGEAHEPGEPAPPRDDSAADEPLETCTTDSPDTIDALVVYTKSAREKAGGTDAMEFSINAWIDETNQSFQNSKVTPRIRLVRMQEVNYVESGDPEKDRRGLKAPGGDLDEVHGLRDAVGADIVGLIVEYTKTETDKTSCGNAKIMETVSNAFESSAFAAIPRICADAPGKWSLTHEFGHLMGARHDWFVDQMEPGAKKPFLFSHGFVHLPRSSEPGPAFRTVMAKRDECANRHKTCDRVLFWSNPNVPFPDSGAPMGVETGDKPANDSQALNDTARTVANFRCRKS